MQSIKKALSVFLVATLVFSMTILSLTTRVFAEDEVKDEEKAEEEISIEEGQEELIAPKLPFVGDVDTSAIEFTSKRLIVRTDKEDALKGEPVIASLDNVYIIQYETEDDARFAFIRLIDVCDALEVDSVITVADEDWNCEHDCQEEGVSLTPEMTEVENPFSEAVTIIETVVDPQPKVEFDVAVIDTGAKDAEGIVSVLGDDGKDFNGHGQKMIDIIKGASPDSKVLSIKAIGDNGVGDISAVYAAIKLAIESNVKVINLSISALKTDDSFVIEDAIREATDKGIRVVGAAGNISINARFTIPGCVDEAIIVGASKGAASGFGETVDYIVDVNTTSAASALVTGLILSDRLDSFDKKIVLGLSLDKALKDYREYGIGFRIADGTGGSSGYIIGDTDIVGVKSYSDKSYIWYDEGGFIDGPKFFPSQPIKYRDGTIKLNGQTITADEEVDFWIAEMQKKMKAQVSKLSSDLHLSTLVDNSPVPGLSYGDVTRNEIKARIAEAHARTLSSDSEGEYSRVVGIAWEWQTLGNYSSPFWDTWALSSWVNELPYGGYGFPCDTFNDLFSDTMRIGLIDGSTDRNARIPTVSELKDEFGWGNKVDPQNNGNYVDVNGDGVIDDNDNWRLYMYLKNEADLQDYEILQMYGGIPYSTGSKRAWIYIVAVTDNMPQIDNVNMDPIDILLHKRDVRTEFGMPQGNGTLANAEFTVKYYDNMDQSGTPEAVWVFKTDENGIVRYSSSPEYFVSGDDLYYDANNAPSIPIGSITIQETKAPEGYKINPEVFTVYFIKNDDGVHAYCDKEGTEPCYAVNTTKEVEDLSLVVDEEAISGFAKVIKKPADGVEQGDAELKNIRFALVNRSKSPVTVNGTSYSKDEIIKVLRLDADGSASVSNNLPYGSYELIELKVDEWNTFVPRSDLNNLTRGSSNYSNNAGYLWEDNKYTFSVTADGETHTALFTNRIARGGIQIVKRDKELRRSEALGGATLEGIELTIKNVSNHDVIVRNDISTREIVDWRKIESNYVPQEEGEDIEGAAIGEEKSLVKKVAPGEDVGKIIVRWNEEKQEYTAETLPDDLPYGTYTIRETKTNSSYQRTDKTEHRFEVREDGTIYSYDNKFFDVNENGEESVDLYDPVFTFDNYVYRSDVQGTKIGDGDSKRFSYVPFKIISVSTGETHVVMTDKNGFFTTKDRRSGDAMEEDEAWAEERKRNPLDDLIGEALLSMDMLAERADDIYHGAWFGEGEFGSEAEMSSCGALPYGSYILEEMSCEQNDGYTLQRFFFTVDEKSRSGLIDLATITDDIPEIATVATVDGKNVDVSPGKEVILLDRIEYRNLKKGETYIAKGQLVDKSTGLVCLDVNGNEITAETEFMAAGAFGKTTVVFKFDASEMWDKETVVFEKVYDRGGRLVAKHEDLEDENQTILWEKKVEPKSEPDPDPVIEAGPEPEADPDPTPEPSPEPELEANPKPEAPVVPQTDTTEQPEVEPPKAEVPNTGDPHDLANNVMLSGVALMAALIAAYQRRIK